MTTLEKAKTISEQTLEVWRIYGRKILTGISLVFALSSLSGQENSQTKNLSVSAWVIPAISVWYSFWAEEWEKVWYNPTVLANVTLSTSKSYHGLLTNWNAAIFTNGLFLNKLKTIDLYNVLSKNFYEKWWFVWFWWEIMKDGRIIFVQWGANWSEPNLKKNGSVSAWVMFPIQWEIKKKDRK